MHIIKPYGRTSVPEKSDKRVLLRPSQEGTDIPEFAESHDELVLAQWISVIDKIARKPTGDQKPTAEQRKLREAIGDAAWKEILKLITEDQPRRAELKKIWAWKLHPYPEEEDTKGGAARGDWFERFCGERTRLDEVKPAEVAQKIYNHLYKNELRKKPGGEKYRGGLIKTRAESIEGNVLLKPNPDKTFLISKKVSEFTEEQWKVAKKKKFSEYTDEERKDAKDEYRYREDNLDIAKWIYEKIKNKLEINENSAAGANSEGGKKKKSSKFSEISGEKLHNHWNEIFPPIREGQAFTLKEAYDKDPALFALHMAVKDCYARLLKNPPKPPAHPITDPDGKIAFKNALLRKLPKDANDLFSRLVEHTQRNQDLARLVRLGKVIHYTAPDPAKPALFETAINTSRYWSTDGQAEIKRAEAFVRVWRRAIVFAARTLKDWADPENEIGRKINGDILMFKGWDHEECKSKNIKLDPQNYLKKCELLFGLKNPFAGFGDEEEQKKALKMVIKNWTFSVRNSVFHFKKLGAFVATLGKELKDKNNENENFIKAINSLWTEDQKKYRERMRETMQGADFHFFFDERQNAQLLTAYFSKEAEEAKLPLPRFGRVLERAHHVPIERDAALPEPAKRDKLEKSPRLRCRYTALKLLYELPFKGWLEKQEHATVNTWIRSAKNKAREAAQEKESNVAYKDLVVSRAEKIPDLAEGEKIEKYFSRLSEETATEMRVQHFYASDPKKARKQAAFIEQLKCDVVASAFAAFLKQKGFTFIMERCENEKAASLCDLNHIAMPEAESIPDEQWQPVLYFLLHLIPVEEVAALRHQLSKWEILAGKSAFDSATHSEDKKAAGKLQRVLRLYMDMHDAKFTGGAVRELSGKAELEALFESPEAFDLQFPPKDGKNGETDKEDARIPIRGLREMMRFGHMRPLEHIFHARKVMYDEVEEYKKRQEDVSKEQETRETLHKEWVDNKDLSDKVQAYVRSLAKVCEHRHLAARATFTDHVRIHRLAMGVLARLVDYVGLWERDLYFVTLAVLWEEGKKLSFEGKENSKAKDKMKAGQIVEALAQRLWNEQKDDKLKEVIKNYFKLSEVKEEKGDDGEMKYEFTHANASIRDRIAHLAMLEYGEDKQGNVKPDLNLTEWVNHTRTLMAYDRKLKNAVTKSVIEMLEREGLELKWEMEYVKRENHDVSKATLSTRQAKHLGDKTIPIGEDRYPIVENLHGKEFVEMAAKLFAGTYQPPKEDDVVALAAKLSGGDH